MGNFKPDRQQRHSSAGTAQSSGSPERPPGHKSVARRPRPAARALCSRPRPSPVASQKRFAKASGGARTSMPDPDTDASGEFADSRHSAHAERSLGSRRAVDSRKGTGLLPAIGTPHASTRAMQHH
jgi:hypothetical protein